MTPNEINKRFAELAGICWHEPLDRLDWFIKNDRMECRHCHKWLTVKFTCPQNTVIFTVNPDFCADPRLVLEVMMKREDWPEFYLEKLACQREKPRGLHILFLAEILDTTGLLALKAIEWIEMQQPK